jgi:hypothetical protein
MHNELRYQAKRHAISENLLKEKIKISASSPPVFFFNVKKKNTHTKTCSKVKN